MATSRGAGGLTRLACVVDVRTTGGVITGVVRHGACDHEDEAGPGVGVPSNFVAAGGADSHLLRNEGTVPAETIAVQLLPTGSTRRIDEPVPENCLPAPHREHRDG